MRPRFPFAISVSFTQYFELSWWAVLAFTYANAYVAEVSRVAILALSLGITVWLLTPWCRRPSFFLKHRTLLLGAFVAVALVDGVSKFVQSHDAIYLIGEALAGFLPFFFARRDRPFSYWVALLNTFLLSLTCVVAEGDFNEYFFFLGFLISLVVNLNAANLYFMAGEIVARARRLTAAYYRQFSISMLSGLLMGAVIFVLFPRDYTWVSPFGTRVRGKSTGYTGNVTFDSSSNLNESSAIALTVESKDPKWLAINAHKFYFRGNSVDTFDGIRWTNSDRALLPYRGQTDLRYTMAHFAQVHRLRIYREASTAPAILYPNVLRGVEAPLNLLGGLRSDASGNLTRINRDFLRYAYDVIVSEPRSPAELDLFSTSALGRRMMRETNSAQTGAQRRAYRLSPEMRRKLLTIPESVKRAAYFQRWVKAVGVNSERQTLRETFGQLQSHFQKNFRFSLIHDFPGDTPFATFLSMEKRGHCEYFATAAALFLRAQGIPARLVLGYHGGKLNRVAGVFEVRELNAHAWVEAYVAGKGWTGFDPSPFVPAGESERLTDLATSYLNAARFWFNRYIVDYNSQTQRTLFTSFLRSSLSAKSAATQWQTNGGLSHLLFLALCGIIPILVGGLGLFWWRRRKFDLRPTYYVVFLKRLTRAGLAPAKNETPGQFLARIKDRIEDPKLLPQLEKAIYEDQYSSHPAAPRDRNGLLVQVRHMVLRTAE